MARRKGRSKKIAGFDAPKVLSSPKAYTSLAYGILTVIILFIIIFLGLKAISQRQTGLITDEAEKTSVESQKKTYEVKEGDSLWSIAQATYNDGYKWVDIAKANSLSNPNYIEKGAKLNLPVILREPPTTVNQKITGGSYTVVEGDNLWTIAVRAYGDGYMWVKISSDNKLANPDLIHPGNILKLPR